MIGILALQGDFHAHSSRLAGLGQKTREVRTAADLEQVSGLVIPGGESSVLLKLLEPALEQALIAAIQGGMPTLATCAGVILLAEEVKSPEQRSLGLLQIGVTRNAYGRQIDSFIDPDLRFNAKVKLLIPAASANAGFEGVFIRAPKIDWVGSKVEVLCERDRNPVLVRQGNILGATFHPELADNTGAIYELLLSSPGNAKH